MDCIELLRELIGFDTVNPPGNEKPAARYLAGILEPMGFKCEVQDLGGSRANLIAVLDGGDGPELMLNGHLDVVPAVGEWDSRSNRIYLVVGAVTLHLWWICTAKKLRISESGGL